GYTATIMGRRRYLPDLTSDNRQRREMAERMALNAPIQGSAADIIKVAMLGVHRALADEGLRSRMLLQVHDELVLEVAEGEREKVEELVRREMGAAAKLSVPLEVSVGYGRSWDDAAPRRSPAAGSRIRSRAGPRRSTPSSSGSHRTPPRPRRARNAPGASTTSIHRHGFAGRCARKRTGPSPESRLNSAPGWSRPAASS